MGCQKKLERRETRVKLRAVAWIFFFWGAAFKTGSEFIHTRRIQRVVDLPSWALCGASIIPRLFYKRERRKEEEEGKKMRWTGGARRGSNAVGLGRKLRAVDQVFNFITQT